MATAQFPPPTTSSLGQLSLGASAEKRMAETAQPCTLLARFLNLAERCTDVLAITAAVCFAYGAYRLSGLGTQVQYSASTVLLSAVGFAFLFVILLERRGGYRPFVSLLAVRDTERILRVTLESFLAALLFGYFTMEHVPRLVVLFALISVPSFVTLSKLEMHSTICHLRSKGYGARKAVIVGAGILGRRVHSALLRSPKFWLDPVAFVDDDPQLEGVEIYESSYQRKRATRVVPGPISGELLRDLAATTMVIAKAGPDRESLIELASAAGMDTYWVREDCTRSGCWIDHIDLDGIALAHFSQDQTRFLGDFAKRAIDLVASASLLVVFALPFALIALFVKLGSPGPVFFRQDRVGKDGSLFRIYKFRTMYQDAPQYSYSPGAGDDPRITGIGRWLRCTSIDELPQLVNVLLGDMSLVGPRPEMPFIVAQYTLLQRRRLSVKPGITGLWQLSADRAFLIHENIEYDLYYVRYRSFFMDIAILLHTVLFAGRGI